jgi:predicted Zn-dependent protease
MVDLLVGALDARRADEGRSAFARAGGGTRVGEQIFDERVRIHSDPADPLLFTSPFNDEGLPNARADWVEGGVLRNLAYSRFWAQRQGRTPTAFTSGYYMAGGDATVDEMVASTERGLLVTRFWYIRSVDPRTLLYTGLTRDGTFLIEGGRVTRAAKNMRWNESPIFILNSVEMMGRPTRVANDSGGTGPAVVVPALKVRGFTFTSVSDAV